MSILTQMIEPRSMENPATKITQDTLAEILSGPQAYTGAVVNPSTALQLTAVYASIRLISETFATLPGLVYRRMARGKTRAPEHTLYSVLHDISNPEQTSVEYRETCQAHILMWGKSYSEISRNGAGQIKALWPITPTRVRPMRNARNELVYEVTLPDEEPKHLSANRILVVQGMLGLSPIAQARQALGLALAAEEYGARFFSNNSRPGGILEHPGHLSEDAQTRLKKNWEVIQGGLSNAHRVAILEEGMKWSQIGLAPEDAQFLETRKFQTSEIARLFRVPPHMIGDLERATFSNIEHQSIDFVTHTIRPWLVRWEQAINKTLFTESERETYFVEFLVDGLLRGDLQSRYAAYAVARQNGWMNANEIRELENMNPAKGLDAYLVNGNMLPVDQAGKTNAQPVTPAAQPDTSAPEEENGDNAN